MLLGCFYTYFFKTHLTLLPYYPSGPGGNDAELYRNKKGFFSINVQVVCDADLEIIDIVARWPGSVHDSTIFLNLNIHTNFEAGRYGDVLLVDDSGYALSSYLLTPLRNPQTPAENLYNE
ncbi:hypothetical protein HCN44_007717 [Aphidius gifuensis]|uniref:DDE Tnp4 domain-containing protein n=1 Tax=Aphidius gifuensis TaxID=684658 RepID=A0A834XLQ3_APHGI|nr:hypothetical protein HCN44_007717 [Aphidius gifuensis]